LDSSWEIEAMMRYDGKPFLELLDCYVLQAIGALDVGRLAALEAKAPQLQREYQTTVSWSEIVALQMNFAPDMSARIAVTWNDAQAAAAGQGLVAEPEEFTRLLVDANFPV
jgi:hypothetical protein